MKDYSRFGQIKIKTPIEQKAINDMKTESWAEKKLRYIDIIISIDAKKSIYRNLILIHIKTLSNLGTEGNFLFLKKNIYKKNPYR